MTGKTWTARLLCAAGAAGLAAGAAPAGLVPTAAPTIEAEGGNYRWTYPITLPTNMRLQSGNYFTLYDFAGYVPGGEMLPVGENGETLWEFSTSKVGPTPERLNPKDDPTVDNLTVKYVGPDADGQVGVGNFMFYSKYSKPTGDSLASLTGRSDGFVDRNITDNAVPTADPTAPPPPPVVDPGNGNGNGGGGAGPTTPEPGTLILAGLGLPVVGLARRLRRKG